jgi:hypothetical protein
MNSSPIALYTKIAQKAIYNPQRMTSLMGMLDSPEGAVQAVLSVVAGIDKLKPIPPEIMPQVAINAYMIMVDVAQEATGLKPDPKLMVEVTKQIIATISSGQGPQNAVERTADQPGPEAMETETEPDADENVLKRMGVA